MDSSGFTVWALSLKAPWQFRRGGRIKLAESPAERSDCQKRLEDIRVRLERSARIQEGEQPADAGRPNGDAIRQPTKKVPREFFKADPAYFRTSSVQ